MQKHRWSLATSWLVLGFALSAFGGIPLMSGDYRYNPQRALITKLSVGVVAIAIGFRLRRRERQAIARGTMAPSSDL